MPPRRATVWTLAWCCCRSWASTSCEALPRIDSHLHLWTPDATNFPHEVPPPEHLNADGRATYESFAALMDHANVSKAIAVQPVNYGQDYSYLIAAMRAHPAKIRGVFVADPSVPPEDAGAWVERTALSAEGWAGIRFNPLKWLASGGVAGSSARAMYRRAGELGLTATFMPFDGLSRHVDDIEALILSHAQTRVVIDHWGFFLQPALGFGGDRQADEESWKALLRLADHKQVHVKVSALFRVATDVSPFLSLSGRLHTLVQHFGSERLLWGSDFPYVTEHVSYVQAMCAMEEWPIWKEISDADRTNIFWATSSRLFGPFANSASEDVVVRLDHNVEL